MKRIFFYLISIAIIEIFLITSALAWDNKVTHKDISEYAAENSVLNSSEGNYMKSLGFDGGLTEKFMWNNKSQSVLLWIRDGADFEDNGSRPFNHFHNPLQPWLSAGLADLCLIGQCQSALFWAQSYDGSQQPMSDDWSWQRTRKLYHLALTSWDPVLRSMFFAETFRGLGQQMHLLQDMAVPAHVRNDAHPLDPFVGTNGHGHYFETWVKENKPDLAKIKAFVPNPVMPQIVFNAPADSGIDYSTLSPITQFYDTNQYNGTNPSTGNNIGLSEYTNANYFSDDTISMSGIWTSGSHSFPYPNANGTNLQDYIDGNAIPTTVIAEDGVADTGFWIQKTGNEPITHFIKPGYLTTPLYTTLGGGNVYERTFFLDDQCHHDYAQLLLPRAVGYSAALLNYFFRGTLEISAPDRCFYGVIDGKNTPQQFTKIIANVGNVSYLDNQQGNSIVESMQTGTLVAVAKYKKRKNQPDSLVDPPTAETADYMEADFSYSISEPYPLTQADLDVINPSYKDFTFNFTSNPIPAGITDLYLYVVFKGTLGNEQDNAIAVGFKDIGEPTHINFWNTSDKVYNAGQVRDASGAEKVTIDEYINLSCSGGLETFLSYNPLAPGQFGRIITLADPGQTIDIDIFDAPNTDGWQSTSYRSIINQDGAYDTSVSTFRGKKNHKKTSYVSPSTVYDEYYWTSVWPNATNDAIPVFSLDW